MRAVPMMAKNGNPGILEETHSGQKPGGKGES